MFLKIGAILVFIASYVLAILFARREGKKAEQLANLRREIENRAKEQERANEIIDNVRGMSDNDVSNRLQDISSNKR